MESQHQSPLRPLKILGGHYREGVYYYIRFTDQAPHEWMAARCVKSHKYLEMAFQTERGLIGWDNPRLQVLGIVQPPAPPPPVAGPLSFGPREKGIA